jgi:hypothetical protein
VAGTGEAIPAGALEAKIQRALAGPDASAGSGKYLPSVTSCNPLGHTGRRTPVAWNGHRYGDHRPLVLAVDDEPPVRRLLLATLRDRYRVLLGGGAGEWRWVCWKLPQVRSRRS